MKWRERAIPLAGVSLFLLMDIDIGVETWQFRNNSELGTAEIISIRAESESTSGSDGNSRAYFSYYPTVRFETRQGTHFVLETTQPFQPPIPDVGDQIPVRYYISGNLRQVRLEYGAWWDWLIAGSITVVSLVFFVITLMVTRREIPEI